MIVITGPTASGKSALAVSVALALGTEIISADSRQIYQGIPIVSAMPTPAERNAVPHHLIDMLPLEAYYSAACFESDALRLAREIMARNGSVVVCGGSMMYVDALCNGIDILPTVPPDIRTQVGEWWRNYGDDWMRRKLSQLDPVHYNRVDLSNMKRVVHAVEISIAAGAPYSSLLTGTKQTREFEIKKFMLEPPREVLFDRINRRVEQMMDAGLEEEARSVFHLRHLNALNTVGLKEMFAMFDGEMDKPAAVARIQKNTRVYAKKQLTWYKRDPDIIHIDPTRQDAVETILENQKG